MLYTITPEQETAALNDALLSWRWGDRFKSLADKSLLLSDIVSKINMTKTDKIAIIQDTLYFLIPDEFHIYYEDDSDEHSCYNAHKNFFVKYANQDFFGAINGVSFTADHFNSLYEQNSIDGSDLLNSSLHFSFIKQIDQYQDLFRELKDLPKSLDEVTIQDIIKLSLHFNLLVLNHLPYSDEHYQQMINVLSVTSEVIYPLITLAACPRTSHMLTKTDFINCVQGNNELELDEYNDLNQAYHDLFGEELIINTGGF